MSQTDYKSWTDFALAVQVSTGEPYWLHLAVSSPDENTGELYRCRKARNGCYIVDGGGQDTLVLTEKSRAAMLKHIEHAYMDEMDPESWCPMALAAEKNQ